MEYERRRKYLAGISLGIVAALVVLLTLFIWNWLRSFSQDDFRDYIRSFGPLGWLVLLGLQFLQVFIALIPGELLETAAGYAFGPWLGTAICYVGVALASSLIFVLTRRYGVKLVEIFVDRERINELRFLNTERKRNNLIFLLYFIPGTPKDLLTYFVGLTDIKLSHFLVLSMIARIPSVVSSTFGGHLLGEARYIGAIVLYGITGLVSALGLLGYNLYLRKSNNRDNVNWIKEYTMNKNEQWLQWAIELQSLAQTGLAYGKDIYDKERYARIREISAEILSHMSDIPTKTVKDLFCNETGYQTPKLDTRAAIFKDGRILLVCEKNGKWSLPGGWCDVNISVGENAVKEVKEEAGLDVTADSIIAIQDRAKHNLPVYAYGICKVFILCSLIGGSFQENLETTGFDYFAKDNLPDLATEKNTAEQIKMCFDAYYAGSTWKTYFD